MNDVVIEARQVTKRYTMADEPISILNGVNLLVHRGEMIVIRGMSGSGKTTLLNVLGGLDTFDEGEIVVAGTSLSHSSFSELTLFRAEKIGFVFQFHNLIPTLTVLENVLCGLEAMRPLKPQDTAQALHYLNRVGLTGHESKFPAQLSGGQQQRVAIARALVKEPEVILADEPTGSLDESTGLAVMDLLSALQTEKQTAVVIVTHNPDLAPHANHHFEMRQGVLCIHDARKTQGEKQCVNS